MTENTANASDSDDENDSDSSFDGHGSFASLGEDENDDEAYREGRNQMARQAVEAAATRSPASKALLKGAELRFKKPGGLHSTPLDFIAE